MLFVGNDVLVSFFPPYVLHKRRLLNNVPSNVTWGRSTRRQDNSSWEWAISKHVHVASRP